MQAGKVSAGLKVLKSTEFSFLKKGLRRRKVFNLIYNSQKKSDDNKYFQSVSSTLVLHHTFILWLVWQWNRYEITFCLVLKSLKVKVKRSQMCLGETDTSTPFQRLDRMSLKPLPEVVRTIRFRWCWMDSVWCCAHWRLFPRLTHLQV